MAESWRTRVFRWGFRWYPAYRGTGGRVTYIAGDWREVRVTLPLSRRTRNYVGTIFGGSIYGAVDPIYMVMLIHVLGPEYIVWDKAASIRFQKPGRSTLFARFTLDEEEITSIQRELEHARSIDRSYTIQLTDAKGAVHATIEKVIYIRRKAAANTPTPVGTSAIPAGQSAK
jgi:acyl-coenzyme A thioesterase PaaI-like protein